MADRRHTDEDAWALGDTKRPDLELLRFTSAELTTAGIDPVRFGLFSDGSGPRAAALNAHVALRPRGRRATYAGDRRRYGRLRAMTMRWTWFVTS